MTRWKSVPSLRSAPVSSHRSLSSLVSLSSHSGRRRRRPSSGRSFNYTRLLHATLYPVNVAARAIVYARHPSTRFPYLIVAHTHDNIIRAASVEVLLCIHTRARYDVRTCNVSLARRLSSGRRAKKRFVRRGIYTHATYWYN